MLTACPFHLFPDNVLREQRKRVENVITDRAPTWSLRPGGEKKYQGVDSLHCTELLLVHLRVERGVLVLLSLSSP